MVVQGRAIGMISIQSLEQEYAFDESQVELLRSVANQAAVAIENARLLVEEKTRAQQLEALNEIALQITSQLDLNSLLRVIIENAHKIMRSDSVSLYTWDADRQAFDKALRVGIEGEPTIPRVNGGSAQIAKTQVPVWVRDTKVERGPLPGFVNARGIRAFAGIPLLYNSRTLGVLYVNYNVPHAFTEQEQKLIDLLAGQAAVAMVKARLYADLVTRHQELAESHEALRQAQELALEAERKRLEAEQFAYLGRIAGSLAHRIGNKGGLIRLCVQDLEKKLNSLGLKDAWFSDQVDTIRRSNQYLLNLADYLFKPQKAIDEKQVESDVQHYIVDAKYYADVPDDVSVDLRCDENLPLVFGNKYLVEAFLELITNSLDAMESSPVKRLTIQAKAVDEWVQVSFSDTGRGISTEDAETIFGLFDQSADSKLTSEEHRGFGLWWVKRFITEMGGSISYNSTPGVGTTFYVRLPRVEVVNGKGRRSPANLVD